MMHARMFLLLLPPFLAPALPLYAQVTASTSGLLREAWVDPVRGNDLSGSGTANQPFRTVSRALDEAVAMNQLFGTVALCDFDADGDLDLIRHRLYQGTRVFRNVNTSHLPIYQQAWDIPVIADEFSYLIRVDADGDGDDDFVHNSAVTGPPYLLWSQNLGGTPPVFAAKQQILESSGAPVLLTGALSTQFAAGDIDGDRQWDVVFFDREHLAAGCGIGRTNLKAWYYRNTGTGFPPRFNAKAPLQTTAGDLIFPACDVSSCILGDIDLDGKKDLVYSDDHEIFWCRNLGSGLFAVPVRIAARHGANAIDVRDLVERGRPGERWLVLSTIKSFVGSTIEHYLDFYTRAVILQPGPVPQITLGEPVPCTLQGSLGPPPADVVIHLRPGLYSAASGEAFPWNCLHGVSLIGEPGAIVDAGSEVLLVSVDIRTGERLYPPLPPRWPRPTWGSGLLRLEHLELRSTADIAYVRFYGNLHARHVSFVGARAGVLLGFRRFNYGIAGSRAILEDCHFEGCTTGLEVGTATFYEDVSLRRCTFDRCGTGISLLDRGHWSIADSRFIGNQRGISAEVWRTCATMPCPANERLTLDLHGNHFVDNADHLSLLSYSSAASNLYVTSWHDTVVGGGLGFRSPASGTEPASVIVRSAVLFPGSAISGGNFTALDIAESSVGDPVLAALNGNVGIAPAFALSAEDGHLVAGSALRDAARLPPPAFATQDADGDPRTLGGRADLGADEIRVPALIGTRTGKRGQPWTLGVLGESAGIAFVLIAPERSQPLALLGGLLWLDPLQSSTVMLPLALDARGVGQLNLSVPPRAIYPAVSVWAQAIVVSGTGTPRLTPVRETRLR